MIFVLEANPLLFANQGFGINMEYKIKPRLAVGADVEYYSQNPYAANNITAIRNMYSFDPKLNYYFLSNDNIGPFISFKIFFTQSDSEIYDDQVSAKSNIFFTAPALSLGYRFAFDRSMTISAYAGLGFKSHNNDFHANNIPSSRQSDPNWAAALEKLNHNGRPTQPDYGLTLGYIF